MALSLLLIAGCEGLSPPRCQVLEVMSRTLEIQGAPNATIYVGIKKQNKGICALRDLEVLGLDVIADSSMQLQSLGLKKRF